ncbi:glutaredoxin, GrxA family [Ursidibacter maritimus]|uniref:Glutaredoxin, GrxA family n=1 Tax=Ursidibacter maritimus TaxID=1331689 RepID=A0A949WMQ0_9PAST|nr:GrxA family glutaredoxin [Ursidibacter maritimus]KAE9540447.1 glutaredoxin [Ursidibacter maritimus]MBV6524529.1 glutaredoxin, GrxA family [Ursidibacter maritimus]MBV6525037.1 glutaredoxin, GrxA family [Ursidibacter maritimus]MBV6527239.1 glutaredoxin, GrxA family [Ursidibacter maritimus]MBV6530085.1 glutaredoxin, GrxA family [Ursidibacter maritimus]
MFVEIYGRLTCPYCTRANALAEKMKAELVDFDFEFIDMIAKNISKEDLEPRVGKHVATVPQIFLDNQHVGGCTDFQALVKEKFGIEV